MKQCLASFFDVVAELKECQVEGWAFPGRFLSAAKAKSVEQTRIPLWCSL